MLFEIEQDFVCSSLTIQSSVWLSNQSEGFSNVSFMFPLNGRPGLFIESFLPGISLFVKKKSDLHCLWYCVSLATKSRLSGNYLKTSSLDLLPVVHHRKSSWSSNEMYYCKQIIKRFLWQICSGYHLVLSMYQMNALG